MRPTRLNKRVPVRDSKVGEQAGTWVLAKEQGCTTEKKHMQQH